MDRRFLLAFVLSTAVVLVFQLWFAPKPEVQPEGENQKKESVAAPNSATTPQKAEANPEQAPVSMPAPIVASEDRKTVTIESDLYKAEVDSLDGTLTSFYLKKYKYAPSQHTSFKDILFGFFTSNKAEKAHYEENRLVNMIGDLSEKNRPWQFIDGSANSRINFQVSEESLKVGDQPAVLKLQGRLTSGLEVLKTITFHPKSYLIDLELRVLNRTGDTVTLHPRLNFGVGNEPLEVEVRPFPRIAAGHVEDKFDTWNDDYEEKPLQFTKAQWLAVMNTYFVTAVKRTDEPLMQAEFVGFESKLHDKKIIVPQLAYYESQLNLSNGSEYRRTFSLFVGPKVQEEQKKFDPTLTESLDLGFFDFLAYPLLALLNWLHGFSHNWGVAIILLTLIVRAAMFPLAFKGMISMRRMSELNPRIKLLREKYKNDKEKLNTEIMAFYKKNNVNPVGGCFPMLMQIPIFFALYSALLPAIELRGQPFMLWMDDLSAPDYTLILPLLMGVSMYVQQTLTPTPAMDPNQAKMMKWMPVVMIFFFLDMPSGLVLYWVISNMFSIFQQQIFNRTHPPTNT